MVQGITHLLGFLHLTSHRSSQFIDYSYSTLFLPFLFQSILVPEIVMLTALHALWNYLKRPTFLVCLRSSVSSV